MVALHFVHVDGEIIIKCTYFEFDGYYKDKAMTNRQGWKLHASECLDF